MAAVAADIFPMEELEALFKSRYTEHDTLYMEAVRKPLDPPPTVVNWYSRPKRIFDWASQERGGQRGHHGNRGHHQGNRNYYQGNRNQYQGNRDQYQGNRGHYQGNRGHHQGNRGHHHDGRSGHGEWHGRDRYNDNRQQQRHEHSNTDYGPSRVFYPGMKDFEQAQSQSQARYNPYQRGGQSHRGSHTQSNQSQSRTQSEGQKQAPT